jgi:enterochelin esterase-like enzyme
MGAMIAVIALSLATSSLFSQAGPQAGKGTVDRVKVHGKSLEGNLEGDSPDRDVFIYLPPSYAKETNRRYPVVYLLHGYGLTAERWMPFANLAATSDKNIGAGTMREMILVNPDAFTKYNGSMYSSSVTIGDWESFIADDLVSYVDSHYRTIPDRKSRGLGGHSMGGYGTMRIGMKRPDVFSSLYAMSSCCLMNNPGGGGGGNRGGAAPAAGAQGGARGDNAGQAGAAPAGRGAPAGAGAQGGRGGQAAAGRGGNAARGGRGGGFANVGSAQAAAWAANPKNPPNFFDEPTVNGQVQPAVAAKYLANSPLVMIDQYVTGLKKYSAIALDVGTADGLAASNRQLVERMTDLGIPHTFETYDGDHTNRVPLRFEVNVLPFFSKNLMFAAP